jgi:hypothetical protein
VTSDSLFLWVIFNVFVLGVLALDLLVLHRKAHAVSLREALAWSCVWVSLALLFTLGIYSFRGGEKAATMVQRVDQEIKMEPSRVWMCLAIIAVRLAIVKWISISSGPTSDDAIVAIRVAQRDLF